MKQKLTALLLVLLLLAVTLVLPVMAAAPYVDDEAAILTLSEVETLEARAAEISEHYGVGVYICIVDDFGDYGYPDVATASYSIYHAQSLGYGSGRDGILLLLSMSNRKYATFVYGDKAEPIFPDGKLIKLENAFLDDFADDDWYDGFSEYPQRRLRRIHVAAVSPPPRHLVRPRALARADRVPAAEDEDALRLPPG